MISCINFIKIKAIVLVALFLISIQVEAANNINSCFRKLIINEIANEKENTNKTRDTVFQNITQKYGNPPAVYSIGGGYGAVEKDIPLFRGVTGPDHSLEAVLQFMDGDRNFELMSPAFRKSLDKALEQMPFEMAYETATKETANSITKEIETSGLKQFAAHMTSATSTGLSPEQKGGSIIKFTNELNSALNYAGTNFEKNLAKGLRINPIVFDNSGNGHLVLGNTTAPKPGVYNEYDFLSNASIRHTKAIYIGLGKKDSATIWDMPWIKITPQERRNNGGIQSFSVEFVNIERKISMEIFEKTGIWPDYELTNLTPQKYIGLFNRNGSIQLSPELSSSEHSKIKPFLDMIEKLWNKK